MRPVQAINPAPSISPHRNPGRMQLVVAAIAIAIGLTQPPATGPASALDHTEAVRHVVDTRIRPWMHEPIIVDALRQQNHINRSLTPVDIERLDAQWRRETISASRPLIQDLLGRDLSQFLRDTQARQAGLFTEIFVVDSRGLNVGQSDVTSDYWQGDEDKWQETYLRGPGAIFIDGVEQDESTQQFQSQVSLSIADPQSGEVIGSLTVGVDVDIAIDLLP